MAASMFRTGFRQTRNLCRVQNEVEAVLSVAMQRQQCRYKMMTYTPKTSTKPEAPPPPKKYLRQKPIHSIYIVDDYPIQKFSFEECITMHKEAARPEMSNTLHVQIYADIELNMTTNKKTKFTRNIRGLLEFPHEFEHKQKKDIYVFSEDPTDWEECKTYGASTVGGEELIGYMNQGIIRQDDIDHCDFIFATPGMAVKLLKMRSLLMDKTPTLANGCIVSDFEPIIKKHLKGVKYKSHKESNSVGKVQVPFGQLYQDMEKLEENFTYMISILSGLKAQNQAPLLQSLRIIAPPSTEIFELNLKAYKEQTGQIQGKEDDDSDEEE